MGFYLGDRILGTGSSTKTIYEFNLSTPFDLSSGTTGSTLDVSAQATTADLGGCCFNEDGSKLFVNEQGVAIYQYSTASAFEITGATYDSVSFDTSPNTTFSHDMWMNGVKCLLPDITALNDCDFVEYDL